MNATWSHILSHLENNLSEGVFKVWLEPLKGEVVSCSASSFDPCLFDSQVSREPAASGSWEIRLTARNDFVAAWVRDKLSQAIIQAGTIVLGSVPALVVTSEARGGDSETAFPAPVSAAALAASLPGAPAVLASTTQLALPVELPRADVGARLNIKGFKHSFEDFVVGPCNRLAHAAASNILQTSTPVDMLFLCSSSGLGKTHLTQAVGRALFAEASQNSSRMEYLTAEEFTTQFVMASKHGNMERFKERFRSLDMLLLEDVHFLRGKDKTQEELLATIKGLQARGGRVVLTSSFAPRDLNGVDSQLVSRFCSGFVASMERPGKETRLGILMEKARRQSVILPQAIAELLAERVTSDVRVLESCLHNLVLKSRLLGRPMSEEMAVEVIGHVAEHNPTLDLDDVVSLICKSFDLTRSQLVSRSRRQNLVEARNMAFYLLRKHTDLTLEEIGHRFNRRHSTVLKGITQVEREMSRQSSAGQQYLGHLKMIERNALRG